MTRQASTCIHPGFSAMIWEVALSRIIWARKRWLEICLKWGSRCTEGRAWKETLQHKGHIYANRATNWICCPTPLRKLSLTGGGGGDSCGDTALPSRRPAKSPELGTPGVTNTTQKPCDVKPLQLTREQDKFSVPGSGSRHSPQSVCSAGSQHRVIPLSPSCCTRAPWFTGKANLNWLLVTILCGSPGWGGSGRPWMKEMLAFMICTILPPHTFLSCQSHWLF